VQLKSNDDKPSLEVIVGVGKNGVDEKGGVVYLNPTNSTA
jgi:hypothetical protein